MKIPWTVTGALETGSIGLISVVREWARLITILIEQIIIWLTIRTNLTWNAAENLKSYYLRKTNTIALNALIILLKITNWALIITVISH